MSKGCLVNKNLFFKMLNQFTYLEKIVMFDDLSQHFLDYRLAIKYYQNVTSIDTIWTDLIVVILYTKPLGPSQSPKSDIFENKATFCLNYGISMASPSIKSSFISIRKLQVTTSYYILSHDSNNFNSFAITKWIHDSDHLNRLKFFLIKRLWRTCFKVIFRTQVCKRMFGRTFQFIWEQHSKINLSHANESRTDINDPNFYNWHLKAFSFMSPQ